MDPKILGTVQLILAILAGTFVFVKVVEWNLSIMLLSIALLITAIHHLTEKRH